LKNNKPVHGGGRRKVRWWWWCGWVLCDVDRGGGVELRRRDEVTSFEINGMGWDSSEHVFRNNILVSGMNYGTKCSIILNLGC